FQKLISPWYVDVKITKIKSTSFTNIEEKLLETLNNISKANELESSGDHISSLIDLITQRKELLKEYSYMIGEAITRIHNIKMIFQNDVFDDIDSVKRGLILESIDNYFKFLQK